MIDPAERLVNLALFIASSPTPVTAAQCRSAGLGYDPETADVAFARQFERDKAALRAAGVVIEVATEDETEAYRLDRAATFARPVDLDPDEVSALRAVAAALAADPAFPFGDDLALALGKLASVGRGGPVGPTELVSGADGGQALVARALAEAVQARKTVTFDYTNTAGERKHHQVDPYGMFLREGRWYLVGRDRELDEVRTYATTRVETLDVNPKRPRTPDFERPDGFDVGEHERLPFQYGDTPFTAQVRFEPDVAWRAERLARGKGTLQTLPDGSAVWEVEARDPRRLAAWIVDEGPAIHAVAPPGLVEDLTEGLRRVIGLHG